MSFLRLFLLSLVSCDALCLCVSFVVVNVCIRLLSPLFFKNKVRTDVVPPAFLRQNSFTPLSSQDQIKRPRLYSMDNLPKVRMTHVPTLPSMQLSEGAELLQSEVSVKTGVIAWIKCTI